jgi:hypothetical protein
MQTTTPPITFDPAARGPLHGVRILDLSRLVAGNMLSLQLADFGADVIKVEPPGGDPLRDWRDGAHELRWKVYARNKRSIVLNLHHDKARMALVRLAAMSDVFIENFRPGTLEKMGLGPDAILQANPDLIIVRVSGFGQTGPYAPLPGFGTLVEAMSGLAARTGFPDREPVLPRLRLQTALPDVPRRNDRHVVAALGDVNADRRHRHAGGPLAPARPGRPRSRRPGSLGFGDPSIRPGNRRRDTRGATIPAGRRAPPHTRFPEHQDYRTIVRPGGEPAQLAGLGRARMDRVEPRRPCSGFAPAPPTQGREPDHVIAAPLQIAACCDTVELANTCRSMLLEDQPVPPSVRAA